MTKDNFPPSKNYENEKATITTKSPDFRNSSQFYGFNFSNNFNLHFNFPKSSVLFKINSTSKVILQLVIHYPHWEYYYFFFFGNVPTMKLRVLIQTLIFEKCSN